MMETLDLLHRELMDLNPSAARSLGEGMEETLTVRRLHVPMQLRKTLASTNVIESAFSELVCKNVKRWRRRRPARALGRVRAPGCASTIPQGHRTQTNTDAHQRTGGAGGAAGAPNAGRVGETALNRLNITRGPTGGSICRD
jgi:hypothetical protein